MEAEQFEVLSKKLDAIIVLLAMDKLEGKSKKDSTLLLNQFGLDYSTIASIVDSTVRAVTVTISDAKKAKGNNVAKKSMATKDTPRENLNEVVEVLDDAHQ